MQEPDLKPTHAPVRHEFAKQAPRNPDQPFYGFYFFFMLTMPVEILTKFFEQLPAGHVGGGIHTRTMMALSLALTLNLQNSVSPPYDSGISEAIAPLPEPRVSAREWVNLHMGSLRVYLDLWQPSISPRWTKSSPIFTDVARAPLPGTGAPRWGA